MNGVSLDLGKTATAITYWRGSSPAEVSGISFSDIRYFGEVLHEFDGWLQARVFDHKLDWASYEEIQTKNKYHSELHFGMVGLLAINCFRREIPLLGVNAMTMKKLVTGTGKAKKEHMIAEVKRRFPHLGDITHDEADSVAAGLTARALFAKSQTTPVQ